MVQTIRGLTAAGSVVDTMVSPFAPTSGADVKVSISQLNSYFQTNTLPLFYSAGMNLAIIGNSTLTITAGACKDSTDASNIFLLSTKNLDITTSGANGLDIGTVAANTQYYIYAIGGTAGYAGLFSLSSSSPTLPAGYTFFKVRGITTTDGSSHLSSIVDIVNMSINSPNTSLGSLGVQSVNNFVNAINRLKNQPTSQSTNWNFPDPEVSDCNVLITNGDPLVNGNFPMSDGPNGVMRDSGVSPNLEVVVSGTSKTLSASDAWRNQLTTNASPVTITMPASTFPVATKGSLIQKGIGQVTFVGSGGVTINSLVGQVPMTVGQFAKAEWELVSTNSYVISGDIISGSNLPLDNIPVEWIVAAWSIRKLRTAYTGFALNVRRSSDNATTDVSFDTSDPTNIVVTLSSSVSAGGDFGTWAGVNNVYVVKQYDQGVFGNDRTISSPTSAQPRIISAGSLETLGFEATVNWYSGNQALNVADNTTIDLDDEMTMFTVIAFDSFQALGTILDKRDNSAFESGYLFYAAPNLFAMQWNTNLGAASISGSPSIIQGNSYALSATAVKNGEAALYSRGVLSVSASLTAAGTSVNSASLLTGSNKAGLASNQTLTGRMSELILFNKVANQTQLEDIINNQIIYYSL